MECYSGCEEDPREILSQLAELVQRDADPPRIQAARSDRGRPIVGAVLLGKRRLVWLLISSRSHLDLLPIHVRQLHPPWTPRIAPPWVIGTATAQMVTPDAHAVLAPFPSRATSE